MAITRQDIADLAVFTWGPGPTSLLAVVSNVEFSLPVDAVEGRGIKYRGKSPQAVKQGGIIRTTLMSDVSSCVRVANVDVSAFTIGGVNFLAYLRGGSFSGSFEHDEAGGVGDYWKYPLVTVKDYASSVTLSIPDSGTANAFQDILAAGLAHATPANAIAARDVAFSITINGVAVTVPMFIADATWGGEAGRLQTVNLSLQGKDCDPTNYPTAPTGTTTLLEKALNAPKTPLAFSLTPKATNSANLAGEMVFSSFSFGFDDGQLIQTQYEFLTHGAVTPTGN